MSDSLLTILQRLDAIEAQLQQLSKGLTKKKKKSRPLTYQEVEDYVIQSLKLTVNDAAALWEHWEGNGFKNGGKPMASWKATASNWERRKIFFPSFKK